MVDLLPLFPALLGVLAALASVRAYRVLYPYNTIKAALEIIAEYRVLERNARDKRAKKKLARLEPEYKAARRLVSRSIIAKMIIIGIVYVSIGIIAVAMYPLYASPAPIPLISVNVDGSYVVPSFMIYFMVYAVSILALRRYLL